MGENFCYLKGLVACSGGRVQDCNMKRVRKCPKETDTPQTAEKKEEKKQSFCYLEGLVDCEPCDVQDCNNKRVRTCPLKKS
ncbi:MAG: hypothetical protein MR425_06440 [Lachnospiraceae bacterium]|nr:hypothetical protein [Lachnospiraceae bacterium]